MGIMYEGSMWVGRWFILNPHSRPAEELDWSKECQSISETEYRGRRRVAPAEVAKSRRDTICVDGTNREAVRELLYKTLVAWADGRGKPVTR